MSTYSAGHKHSGLKHNDIASRKTEALLVDTMYSLCAIICCSCWWDACLHPWCRCFASLDVLLVLMICLPARMMPPLCLSSVCCLYWWYARLHPWCHCFLALVLLFVLILCLFAHHVMPYVRQLASVASYIPGPSSAGVDMDLGAKNTLYQCSIGQHKVTQYDIKWVSQLYIIL